MSLLSGPQSATRFNIEFMPPDGPNFEAVPFRAIQDGSILRESTGFLPFEPGVWKIANKSWAFRIRSDKRTPDANQVKEKLGQLIRSEREDVGPPSMFKIRELKALAEAEVLDSTSPKTKMIECVIIDDILFVGSVSNADLGIVSAMLLRLEVKIDFKTPWVDAGLKNVESPLFNYRHAGESVLGCHFLQHLIENNPNAMPEPEHGQAKLITASGARISITGAIMPDLDQQLDDHSILTSVKLIQINAPVTFDGLSYRISGLKHPTKFTHWTETILDRVERINDLYEWMDEQWREWAVDHLEAFIGDEVKQTSVPGTVRRDMTIEIETGNMKTKKMALGEFMERVKVAEKITHLKNSGLLDTVDKNRDNGLGGVQIKKEGEVLVDVT